MIYTQKMLHGQRDWGKGAMRGRVMGDLGVEYILMNCTRNANGLHSGCIMDIVQMSLFDKVQ